MPRLIDADALRVQISSLSVIITALRNGKGTLFEYMEHYRDSVLRIIDEAPTLDVASVAHGRWVGLEYDGYADGLPVYDLWGCSECGEEQRGEEVPDTYLYCPYCGAKMDREANTDD